jgi:hypothetical protein
MDRYLTTFEIQMLKPILKDTLFMARLSAQPMTPISAELGIRSLLLESRIFQRWSIARISPIRLRTINGFLFMRWCTFGSGDTAFTP